MLIQFSFKNFKSFREEATLDLSAAKMTEFSERVVSVGNEKILPVAAIYGANASGKSNIYNAFEYMSEYVVNSFKYGDEEEKFEEFRPTPFLFDSTSANAESSFEVYFTLPGDKSERTYNYGFCVNREGVTEEWLNSKAKTARKYSTIFYRGLKESELDLSGFPTPEKYHIWIYTVYNYENQNLYLNEHQASKEKLIFADGILREYTEKTISGKYFYISLDIVYHGSMHTVADIYYEM